MRIKSVRAWWVRIPIETSRQHRSDFGQVRTFDAAILRIETSDGIVGKQQRRTYLMSGRMVSAVMRIWSA